MMPVSWRLGSESSERTPRTGCPGPSTILPSGWGAQGLVPRDLPRLLQKGFSGSRWPTAVCCRNAALRIRHGLGDRSPATPCPLQPRVLCPPRFPYSRHSPTSKSLTHKTITALAAASCRQDRQRHDTKRREKMGCWANAVLLTCRASGGAELAVSCGWSGPRAWGWFGANGISAYAQQCRDAGGLRCVYSVGVRGRRGQAIGEMSPCSTWQGPGASLAGLWWPCWARHRGLKQPFLWEAGLGAG